MRISNDFQIVIIGSGVIGLSIADALARSKFKSVLIIEKEKTFGNGVSSRNSEVIHSGIYYPKDSLKSSSGPKFFIVIPKFNVLNPVI